MAGNVNVATLTAKLILDTKEFSSGVDTATSEVGRITSDNAWQQAGKSLKTLGKAATVAGGAIVSGAGVAAKAAIDFEDAFAGVKKTINFEGTQEEAEAFFGSLEQGILDISYRMPVAATEIAGVAEAAGQLGIQNENILSFTETMIGLGSATNLTAEEAAVSLAQFANVTQMSQGDFDRLGSVIVELGNNMAVDERNIVSFGTELAGLGQMTGMSEANIMALGATMASLGLEAASSGTAMQRLAQDITSSIATGGEHLEVFASTAGMTAEEFATAWETDAASAFEAFITGLGSKEAYEQLDIFDALDIRQMREIDMLQRLAGNSELLSSALDMSNTAWDENSALQTEVAKRNETTASQMQMVKNQLTGIAVEAGQALLPVIRDLLNQARPLLEQLSTYLKEHPDTVQRVAEFGAKLLAVGTAVTVIVNVVNAIGSLISAIKTIGSVIGFLTGGGAAAGGAAAAGGGGIIAGLVTALSGIMPVIAAVGAAVGVFALAWHNNWFGIQEKFGAVKEWIVGKFGELKLAFEEGGLQAVIQKIGTDISTWWNETAAPWLANLDATITEWFQNVWNTIVLWWENAINSLGEWFANIWTKVTESLTNIWNKVKETLTNVWNKTKETLTNIWNKLTETTTNIFNKVRETLTNVYNNVKETLTNVWNNVKEKTTAIWNDVKEKMTNIFNTVKEKLASIWNTVKEKLASIWDTIKTKMENIKETVTTRVTEIYEKAKNTLTEAYEKVTEIFSNIQDAITEKINAARDAVGNAVDWMKDKISSIIDAISDAWERVKEFASNAWDGLTGGGDDSYGGAYASGGHVTAGKTYLVGEEGPELFVPHASGYVMNHEDTVSAIGGGDISIYIQGDVYDDPTSMRRKLKSAVVSVLREQVAYG